MANRIATNIDEALVQALEARAPMSNANIDSAKRQFQMPEMLFAIIDSTLYYLRISNMILRSRWRIWWLETLMRKSSGH